jgi:hypothetical protein
MTLTTVLPYNFVLNLMNEEMTNSCSGYVHRGDDGGQHHQQQELPPSSPIIGQSSTRSHTIMSDVLYNNNNNNNNDRPLRKHTASIENLTADISFINLREEDADILELGVEEKADFDLADFDSDGRRLEANTSLHHRLSSASLSDLLVEEGLLVGGIDDGSCITGDDNDVDDGGEGISMNNENIISSRSDIATATAASSSNDNSGGSPLRRSLHHDESMPVIAEDSSITIPHHSSDLEAIHHYVHHQDGGDADENDTADDYYVGGSPGSSSNNNHSKDTKPVITADDVDVEALALRISSGRAHHRSVSFDRRMNESAQFAEAVGEDPSLLLQKIIEEDSSSDFDDDDIDEGVGDMLIITDDGDDDEVVLEELGDSHVVNARVVNVESPVVVVEATTVTSASEDSNSHNNSNSNSIEPKCVSTDLSQVSPKEQEEICNRLMMERRQSFERKESDENQLAANNSSSAPPTPIPSPAKARVSPFTSFHPPYVDWKFSRQNSSSASLEANRYQQTVVAQNNSDAADFRGIRLPEITKRGVARGNYAQLHRKAWLEVSDKHHRYGKNLRMYYKHWESLGHPYHMFFDWLDSKGEAQGNELPNLPEIPRSVLDSDTVQYITDPEISSSYALDIVADPADGSARVLDREGQNPICTGKEGWIFVLRDHVFYGSQKVIAPTKVEASNNNGSDENNTTITPPPTTKPRQRFHHSSFFGGKAVASAGIFLTDEHGRLTHLYPHSGHYRPGEAHVQRVLFFMQQLGVELSTFVVDMQQLFKVSRKFAPKGGSNGAVEKDKENSTANNGQGGKHPTQQLKKAKKTDCLHLMCGLEVACFLAHKALMIEREVFHQIHKIRRIPKDKESRRVCNILNYVK